MFQTFTDLLNAWSGGTDCLFAIHDWLLENGFPKLASYHNEKGFCKRPWDCPFITNLSSLTIEKLEKEERSTSYCRDEYNDANKHKPLYPFTK